MAVGYFNKITMEHDLLFWWVGKIQKAQTGEQMQNGDINTAAIILWWCLSILKQLIIFYLLCVQVRWLIQFHHHLVLVSLQCLAEDSSRDIWALWHIDWASCPWVLILKLDRFDSHYAEQKFLDTLLLPFCSDIQALENCVFPFMVPDVEFKLFVSGTSQLPFIMSYSEIFSTTQ